MPKSCPSEQDAKTIQRSRKRLLRQKNAAGTWAALEKILGVNHKYMIDLANHGIVPSNKDKRVLLGLPRVMPSERKPRVQKVIPMLGSPCWHCMAFKRIRPKKWKR